MKLRPVPVGLYDIPWYIRPALADCIGAIPPVLRRVVFGLRLKTVPIFGTRKEPSCALPLIAELRRSLHRSGLLIVGDGVIASDCKSAVLMNGIDLRSHGAYRYAKQQIVNPVKRAEFSLMPEVAAGFPILFRNPGAKNFRGFYMLAGRY